MKGKLECRDSMVVVMIMITMITMMMIMKMMTIMMASPWLETSSR